MSGDRKVADLTRHLRVEVVPDTDLPVVEHSAHVDTSGDRPHVVGAEPGNDEGGENLPGGRRLGDDRLSVVHRALGLRLASLPL